MEDTTTSEHNAHEHPSEEHKDTSEHTPHEHNPHEHSTEEHGEGHVEKNEEEPFSYCPVSIEVDETSHDVPVHIEEPRNPHEFFGHNDEHSTVCVASCHVMADEKTHDGLGQVFSLIKSICIEEDAPFSVAVVQYSDSRVSEKGVSDDLKEAEIVEAWRQWMEAVRQNAAGKRYVVLITSHVLAIDSMQNDEAQYLANCNGATIKDITWDEGEYTKPNLQESAGVTLIAMPFQHFDAWRRMKFDESCICKKRFHMPCSIRTTVDTVRLYAPVLLALEYYQALWEGIVKHDDMKVGWVKWNLDFPAT